ncbi:uncharacterized protein PV06_02868 [Exophiala oligosperma]|uniref:Uncharacterized protein n=1 Tax=Exophiala oligosperma TaxID=215243 RepID=A0A0D2CBK5_9EURO|nr:uncharacterized protein PV06_02868 [Exophiala oligosperma]KIW47287.1 hypothetical protein PV06_02868 [Exophiala oligosperma]
MLREGDKCDKAKEWREDGYGCLHRPSINKHFTSEKKLGAVLTFGEAKPI